jgi:hypothetical protein
MELKKKGVIAMEPTEPTFYRIKRHEEYDAYLAVVLLPGSNVPVEKTARETIAEVVEDVTRSYGEQAERVTSERFAEILKLRTIHSPEMLKLLESNVMGDLRSYTVYGSYRPISAAWARIPDAVYLPVPNWQGYGYSTYVATPAPIEREVQESYELTFLSRPSPNTKAP